MVNAKQRRNLKRHPKVGVAEGYGPRHAENAQEGHDLTKVNSDVVPAMLTPREAVMNRNAAELAGRGNIEKLNAVGNELAEKGVDLAAAKPRGERSEFYAGGKDMKEKAKKFQGGAGEVPQPGKWKPSGALGGSLPGLGGDPRYLGPPEQIGGMAGPMPGLDWQHKRNMANAGPGLDWQHRRNTAINAGFNQPSMPSGGWQSMPGFGGPPYGEPAGSSGVNGPIMSDIGFRQNPNLPMSDIGFRQAGTGGTPGMSGMPTGVGSPFWQRTHPNYKPPMQSQSFYPPRQALQGGTSGVEPIGQAVGGAAYGAPVNLSAPEILSHLQKSGKEAGLSTSQIAGLAKAFEGILGGYGGGAGSAADMATAPTAGYQGGISDIGYPPMIGPNMDFHADKGGWIGGYDPNYMIQRYARGTSSVGGWGGGGPFR